jgi:phage shock protein PspC (stress-responsive transcriptional regulator)
MDMTGIYESMWRNGLVRPTQGRTIAGVCAGLARRVGIGEWPMRWLFILAVIVLPGSPLLFYPILWILMPDEEWVARTHGSGPAQQQPYGYGAAPGYGTAPQQPYTPPQPYSSPYTPEAPQPPAGQPPTA